jgi:hypothetical protein
MPAAEQSQVGPPLLAASRRSSRLQLFSSQATSISGLHRIRNCVGLHSCSFVANVFQRPRPAGMPARSVFSNKPLAVTMRLAFTKSEILRCLAFVFIRVHSWLLFFSIHSQLISSALKVPFRSLPQFPPEHRNERARAVVAELESDRIHALAPRQTPQRVQQFPPA